MSHVHCLRSLKRANIDSSSYVLRLQRLLLVHPNPDPQAWTLTCERPSLIWPSCWSTQVSTKSGLSLLGGSVPPNNGTSDGKESGECNDICFKEAFHGIEAWGLVCKAWGVGFQPETLIPKP